MKATIQNVHVNDDPEAVSALALFLMAAGYEVETDFDDGTVFISADAVDPAILLDDKTPMILARQLRDRLDDMADDVELAELSNSFRNPAA